MGSRASIALVLGGVWLGACGSAETQATGSSGGGATSSSSAGGHGGADASSAASGGGDTCAQHCNDGLLDCGEIGFDCGGDCSPCGAFDIATVCGPDGGLPWKNPHLVAVENPDGTTYTESVQEPEVRTFGGSTWLFFNDDGGSTGDKDLRYARWDGTKSAFVALGLIPGNGVESSSVDGNPTLDRDGHFYFVSTRSYPNPTETIYGATFSVTGQGTSATGLLSNVERLSGLSRTDVPWATQGVEVTWNGSFLYFDEAKFDTSPPSQSDIVAAKRSGESFVRLSAAEQTSLLGQINTPTFLEYAESLSHDELDLYFTRTHFDPSDPTALVICVMHASRASTNQGFGPALDVAATAPTLGVLMEAPSLSPDEKTLYYHRKGPSDSTSRLYAVERP